MCVGQQFALTEAGSTIVRLVQMFKGVEERDEDGGDYKECIRISLSVWGGVKVGMVPRQERGGGGGGKVG